MSSQDERRDKPRYNAHCQCWIEQESITLFGTATNLSESGLFLQTLPLIECGSKIDIRINLQDMGDLHATGEVCWKSRSKPAIKGEQRRDSKPPGMGIKFEKVTSGGDLLKAYFTNRAVPTKEVSKILK